jgi:hypothetical protein
VPRIITLTSDFGVRDPFVGIMKGVILGLCPDARLVDLTHEIPPQDVLAGALALEAAVPFFPPGTVHLAVVDPGVGSARRPLAVAARGHLFVGPDNGLLTPALAEPGWRAVRLEAPEYRLAAVSRTFHGRDIFAPAAAHLALGVSLYRLGPEVEDPVRVAIPRARLAAGAIEGEVIAEDRFGNLITSVTADLLAELRTGAALSVELGDRRLGGLLGSYAEAPEGAAGAIIGSTGRLEIFVRNGSAAAALGAGRGTRVRVRS